MTADGLGQNDGRVVEGGEEVEVGAGVRASEQRPPVPDDGDPLFPILFAEDRGGGTERRPQFVRHRNVAQDIPGVPTLLLCDVTDTRALVLLVLGCLHVEDVVVLPRHEAPQGVRLAVRRSVERGPCRRIGEQSQPIVARGLHGVLPARDGVEEEPAGEVEAHGDRKGQRQCDDLAAMGPRVVAGGQALLDLLGGPAADEQVPVQWALRRRRHVGHQLDRPGVEGADHRE